MQNSSFLGLFGQGKSPSLFASCASVDYPHLINIGRCSYKKGFCLEVFIIRCNNSFHKNSILSEMKMELVIVQLVTEVTI